MTLLKDRRYLGAMPGILMSLHTWGRTLSLHPHLHCLVTAGGLRDGQWIVPDLKPHQARHKSSCGLSPIWISDPAAS
jgi:hypothetical protein